MSNNDRANLRNWDAAQVEQHNRRIQMGRLHRLSANGSTPLSEAAERAIDAARIFAPESPVKPAGIKGVIRQSSRQMNKTEARFEQEHLKPLIYSAELFSYEYEGVTLKIANGCRYTPDFWAVDTRGVTRYYEIKAKAMIWDDAIVKLKVAAAKYVNCEFYLCAWGAEGWAIQRVIA